MASSSAVAVCQSTQALEELLLQNNLFPTSDAISHCEQSIETICRIILGNNYHEIPDSNPTVYTSTVDGVILVLAPSGSYALGAWDQSAVIPCVVAGTPSGNTFFDLACQKLHRAKDLGVVLLKAEKGNKVVFEVDAKGVRFEFQYFQSSNAKTWSNEDITWLLQTNVSLSNTSLFNFFSDIARLRHMTLDMSIFSSCLRLTKLWALRRGLMSSRFGHLDDRTLIMMTARIFLLDENPSCSHSVKSFVEIFFLHWSMIENRAQVQGLRVLSVDGERNVSNIKSKSVSEWLRTELQTTAKHVSGTANWSWSSLIGEPVQERSLQFLSNGPYYLQLDVSHWGASPSLGAKYFDWMDQKVSIFYKELCDLHPECYPRAWPIKFVDPSEADPHPTSSYYEGYKSFYVIHLNSEGFPVGSGFPDSLNNRILRFLTRVREDEQFNQECCQVDSLVHSTLPDRVPYWKVDSKDWGLILCEDTELPDDMKNIQKAPDSEKLGVPPGLRESSGQSLRTAREVLERLRWDPAYDICKFVIGYKDRHEGLMEIPAEKWMKRSKSEEKDWIPESRIQYFKTEENETRVWDRATKTDSIFNPLRGRGAMDV